MVLVRVQRGLLLTDGWGAGQQRGRCCGMQGRGFASQGLAQLGAAHLPVLAQPASLPELTASASEVWRSPHNQCEENGFLRLPVSIHPETGPCRLQCTLGWDPTPDYRSWHRLAGWEQDTSLAAGKVAKQTLFYQVFIICVSFILSIYIKFYNSKQDSAWRKVFIILCVVL